jgi:hypothetical protein
VKSSQPLEIQVFCTFVERDQNHALKAAGRLKHFLDCANRNVASAVMGETVNARADRWECDAREAPTQRNLEQASVARLEQFVLSVVSTAPLYEQM